MTNIKYYCFCFTPHHLQQGSIFPVIWLPKTSTDDCNLIQTIKITSKVALRASEVLLNHKSFQKFLYDFINFSCVLITSHPLKTFRIMENYKQLVSVSMGGILDVCSLFLGNDLRLSFL